MSCSLFINRELTFRSVPLFERDLESDIMELDGQSTDEICATDLLTCDNASTASLCSVAVNSSTEAISSTSVCTDGMVSTMSLI